MCGSNRVTFAVLEKKKKLLGNDQGSHAHAKDCTLSSSDSPVGGCLKLIGRKSLQTVTGGEPLAPSCALRAVKRYLSSFFICLSF